MSTSKYASVLFQSQEVYDIGPFRSPVYKTLTPAEAKAFTDFERAQTENQYSYISVARRIAQAKGVKTKAILDILRDSSNEEQNELVFDYADEMQEVQLKMKESATKERAALVTVVMRSRGRVKLPGEVDYIKTSDWSETDTEGLLTVADSIFEFINWEHSGWPSETTTEETDDASDPLEPPAPTNTTID